MGVCGPLPASVLRSKLANGRPCLRIPASGTGLESGNVMVETSLQRKPFWQI